jgi:hypothetical protein
VSDVPSGVTGDGKPDHDRFRPPPVWAGPLFRTGPWIDPDPGPAPVFSRWRGGETTFGPVGRVLATLVLVVLVVLGAAFTMFGWGQVFIAVYVPVAGLFLARQLRHVWRKDRIL